MTANKELQSALIWWAIGDYGDDAEHVLTGVHIGLEFASRFPHTAGAILADIALDEDDYVDAQLDLDAALERLYDAVKEV